MGSGITVTSVTTPALFGGPPETPSQIVRVRILRTRPVGPLHVTVHDVGGGGDGSGITTPYPRIVRADTADAYAGTDARADLAPDAGSTAGPDTGSTAGSTARPGIESTVEVAVRTPGAAPGTVLPAAVRVTTPDGRPLAELPFDLVVAEPGWTVRLAPHFHYDPMWWNTQAAYTALWGAPLKPGEAERGWECTGVPAFTLIPLHLQQAREDPAYRFAGLGRGPSGPPLALEPRLRPDGPAGPAGAGPRRTPGGARPDRRRVGPDRSRGSGGRSGHEGDGVPVGGGVPAPGGGVPARDGAPAPGGGLRGAHGRDPGARHAQLRRRHRRAAAQHPDAVLHRPAER